MLFVPGNAGSYKQVRSLGSVGLRMYQDLKKSSQSMIEHNLQDLKQLDFFSIDFNEEKAGIFGGFLSQQIDFVSESIGLIESLYDPHDVKIILMGHSIVSLTDVTYTTLTYPKYRVASCLEVSWFS